MDYKVITLHRECNQGNATIGENIAVVVGPEHKKVEYDMNGVGFKAGDRSSVSINHNSIAVFSEIIHDNKIEITFVSKNGYTHSLLEETLSIEILTDEVTEEDLTPPEETTPVTDEATTETEETIESTESTEPEEGSTILD